MDFITATDADGATRAIQYLGILRQQQRHVSARHIRRGDGNQQQRSRYKNPNRSPKLHFTSFIKLATQKVALRHEYERISTAFAVDVSVGVTPLAHLKIEFQTVVREPVAS